MRILHTSDWHLGALFCERSRLDSQRHFLRWLLDTIAEREVDALILAGDVFDLQNPPADALAAYYGFLADLARLEAPTSSGGPRTAIVVGGNHDSPTRIDAPREALRALEVVVVGGYDPERKDDASTSTGMLVPLRDGAGSVRLVVAAVPYLNDWRIGVRAFDATAAEQLESMHEAFARVYSDLANKAEAAFPGVPRIATGHLTCLATRGARRGEGDYAPQDVHRVGTLGAVDPSVFDASFRYVALGHIHRGFPIDAAGRVRYSGSPVQVSTSEAPDDRKVVLVTVEDDQVQVESLEVPVHRRLLSIKGTRPEVRAALASLEVPPGEERPYVVVEMTLDEVAPLAERALLAEVATELGGKVEIVHVRTLLARKGAAPGVEARERVLADLQPEHVFLHAWRTRHGRDAVPPDAILQRFRALLGPRAEQADARTDQEESGR